MQVKAISIDKDIMTLDDQIKSTVYHDDSITFNYELNDKTAKAKLEAQNESHLKLKGTQLLVI